MADVGKSSRVLDEAIGWHLRLDEATEEGWAAFTRWLETGPANRLAFDRVVDMDDELGNLALHDVAETRVLPFVAIRRFVPWIAAGALAASVALAFAFLTPAPHSVEYATRTGETRAVLLADGTRIDLNTATKLAVEDRHVMLESGEALFHVKRDAQHPFTVTAGDRTIRDIGTVFDILRHAGTLNVVVSEGRVGVSGGGREIALQAGDKLVHSEADGSTWIEKADPAQELAWTKGYLVYRNAPLSAVARDLNRYFPTPISLDEQAGDQRFTGVLRIGDQNAVVASLSRFLHLRVDHDENGKIVLRAIAAKP